MLSIQPSSIRPIIPSARTTLPASLDRSPVTIEGKRPSRLVPKSISKRTWINSQELRCLPASASSCSLGMVLLLEKCFA